MAITYLPRKFCEYTPEALTAAVRQLARAAGLDLALTVRFGPVHPAELQIRFLRGADIELVCSPSFSSEERRDFYTNRWFACWPLLAATRERFPELVGRCTLWADDIPYGPGLGFCGNATSTVLIPDATFLETGGYAELRAQCEQHWLGWGRRRDICFWRGASTGSRDLLRVAHWRELPRFKLCLAAREMARPDLLDVGVSRLGQIEDDGELEQIRQSGLLRPEVPQLAFMASKLSIDIDGNTCSWPGLFTKLLMGVTVLKVDSELGFRQWYYDRLVPWRNFVPISTGMGELADTVADLLRNGGEAEAIARRGRELAESLTWDSVIAEAAARIAATVRP